MRKNNTINILIIILLSAFANNMSAQSTDAAQNIGMKDVRKNATFFSNGLQSKYNGDTQAAISNFEQALVFMPDDAASMFELSHQYAIAGRNEDAFNMAKKAAKLDKDNKWYQLNLADFYKRFEQYDELIELFENLSEKYPDDIDILSELIDDLLAAEQYDKALKQLDILEKQVGYNEVINTQRVEIYKRQGKTKDVIAELQKMIQANPENSRNYSMLAQVYMDAGDEKEAMKMYEKVKATNPDDPYINVSLLEYYEKAGQDEKAFNELLAAIRNKNLDLTTKTNIYEYWFKKKETSGRVDEQARKAGEAFIETYPDNKIGYVIMGSFYINNNDIVKSNEMYNKALQCDSTDFISWQNMIINEAQLNDYNAVLAHSLKAIGYYPMQPVFYWFAGNASVHFEKNADAITYLEKGRKFVADAELLSNFDSFLGDLYHQTGEEEKAYSAFQRVLSHQPDNVLVLNNYAYYLSLDSKDLDKALEMSRHAVELMPKDANYLDTYAWVLYKMGRYAEAEKQMKKVMEFQKEPSGTVFEHYGDILYRLDKKEEALKYWNKALKTGTYSDKLEKKLKDGVLYE